MVLPDPVKEGIRKKLAKAKKDCSDKVEKSQAKAAATLQDETEIQRKADEIINEATKDKDDMVKDEKAAADGKLKQKKDQKK